MENKSDTFDLNDEKILGLLRKKFVKAEVVKPKSLNKFGENRSANTKAMSFGAGTGGLEGYSE